MNENKSIVLRVDVSKGSWRQVFWQVLCYAFQPVLVPALLILSRLLRRPFEIGVTYHTCKDETTEA